MLTLNKRLYREDKLMVAVKHDTDENYINQILRGERRRRSKKARAIVADLEKLADENTKWLEHKAGLMEVPVQFQ